tara:strand:+ start:116 stop:475 length:360 start_codon:yes stop_codon:yes gene_type:complete
MDRDEFQAMLADLKVEYIDDLKQRRLAFDTLIKNEDRAQLFEEFHKIKGTGKTYGLDLVSEVAGHLEAHLENNPQADLDTVQQGCLVLDAVLEADSQGQKLSTTEFELYNAFIKKLEQQ